MRIAIDAMGGDDAPATIVEGALTAARSLGIGVLLAGPRDRIEAELARHPGAADVDVGLIDAPEFVAMSEPPISALRRKPRASIRLAAEAVARGEASALFSAGNTGATVMAAHAALGMIPGVDRPALATIVPTRPAGAARPGRAVLLDVGANVECRAHHLVQFALMGTVYARLAFGLAEPTVGLLSIGEEETKGNDLIRDAHQLFKATGLRFVGNVEARDVYTGQADVIVCDGFTGNIALKISEGLVELVEQLLREELSTTVRTRVGYLLARRSFRRFRKRVDYSEYGGAPLLGVAGACVVGHGRSSAKAVRNAVAMAHRVATEGVTDRIQHAFGQPLPR